MTDSCPNCKEDFNGKPELCPNCGKALYRVCSVCGKKDLLKAEWYKSNKTDKIVCGDCFKRFHQDQNFKKNSDIDSSKNFSKELFQSNIPSDTSIWVNITVLIASPIILALLVYAILIEVTHSFINNIESSFIGGSSIGFNFGGIVELLLILVIIFSVLPLIFNTFMLHIATNVLKFKKRSLGKAFLVTLTATILGFFIGLFIAGLFGPFSFILIVFIYLLIIKKYYKVDYLQAFLAWLLSSALVFGIIIIVFFTLLSGSFFI